MDNDSDGEGGGRDNNRQEGVERGPGRDEAIVLEKDRWRFSQ